jgi:methyl-accepting chemotaxis protein
VATVVVLAAIIALFTALGRDLSRRARRVADAAQRVADGDITQELDERSSDELGELARSVDGMIVYIREVAGGARALASGTLDLSLTPRSADDVLTRDVLAVAGTLRDVTHEVQALAQAVVAGRLDERGDAQRFAGAYRGLVVEVNGALEGVVLPLRAAATALHALAARDLGARMATGHVGEYAAVERALNAAAGSLDEALTGVGAGADEVWSAAGQIRDASSALAGGAADQAARLGEAATGVHELNAMAVQNSTHAESARAVADAVRDRTAQGATELRELDAVMARARAAAEGHGGRRPHHRRDRLPDEPAGAERRRRGGARRRRGTRLRGGRRRGAGARPAQRRRRPRDVRVARGGGAGDHGRRRARPPRRRRAG